ncbi:aminotransferase class III-fold pyridoxal phosphate-dependent enzyme [Streptomyces ficellus]|uniref:Aminotransferase class III-fold pyridoxal phosphate-dependent enzyme n=1 Tax=Streptomyces ficellus TaxID=1977088 RepID=A0ABT7ZC93_9ACTN|nr:aminotransferase class III-fold pyridoxal phosphate-dependent enzyme [Streptomyces ficellus]MDN3297068.1 aminotransferase class III-fold pyridoxal phosphate-dependent enzyme [Streptomyces ficellus]
MTTLADPPVRPDTATEVVDRYRRHLSKGRASLGEMFGGDIEVSSKGPWVRTAEGRDLLNCGGYGVLITGARHPTVVAEVIRQLHTNPVATRLLLEPEVARAAEALAAVTPAGLDKVHFACSGAEAVEAALKMARTHGKRHLVSMVDGYHGKTFGALSVTAKDLFQAPFRPLLPDVSHVPFGDAEALREVLARHRGTACVIVEPVQGEAGVVIPPAGYLRDVAALCREYDAFFVLDEVQTGLGRLGHWWGADREGVVPDVLLVGKGLSGGVVPVSAAVATAEAFGAFDKDPFIHTSTFSGSPLAMAAAQGAIRAIKEEGLVDASRELGARLVRELDRIARQALGDRLLEVRGAGLLIGIEFTEQGLAGDLLLELLAEGVIANHSLNSHMVLRLTPPAVLTEEDVAFLLAAYSRAVANLVD